MNFIRKNSIVGIVAIITIIIFMLNSQLAIGADTSISNNWEMNLSLQGGTSTAVSNAPIRSHSMGTGQFYLGHRTRTGFGFGVLGQTVAIEELTYQMEEESRNSQQYEGAGMGIRVGQKIGRFEFFAGSTILGMKEVSQVSEMGGFASVGRRFSVLNSTVGFGIDVFKGDRSALTFTASAGYIEPFGKNRNFGTPVTTSLGLAYNYKFTNSGSGFRHSSHFAPNTHVYVYSDGRIFYYLGKGLLEIARVAPQLGTAVVKGVFGVLKAL